MFNFKKKTCILYHFGFLDWLPTHYFLYSITHFLPLKSYFLATILPILAMCFVVLRGFVYTIAVYVYAFRLAFSSILHCVLHHFTLHLASKRTAFSTKTHCVQHQNALHLAANRTEYSSKLAKNRCKQHSILINIHFARMYNYPLFASKQTFARIDFLRQGERLVAKRALIMLKFLLKRLQWLIRGQVNEWGS